MNANTYNLSRFRDTRLQRDLLLCVLALTAACGLEPSTPALRKVATTDEQPVLPGLASPSLCAGCDFSIESVAQVGSELDTIFPKPRGTGVVTGSNRRFYTCPVSERGRIGEYAYTGELVGLRGKFGEGPGESRGCHQIAGSGRHLVTLNNDRVLWSEHFGDSARTIRLPTRPRLARMAILPDSTIVIVHDGPPSGALLVVRDPLRKPEFLELDSNLPSESLVKGPVVNSLWLTPGRRNTFYLVNEFFTPRVEEWSADGLLRSWALHAPWFVDYDAEALVRMVQQGVASVAAVPHTSAIRIDSDGRLWTLTVVPQPDPERSAVSVPQMPDEHGSPAVAQYWGFDGRNALDAVMAVYQLTDSSSNLLAYARVDPALSGFADDSTAYEEWIPDPDLIVYRMFEFRPPQALDSIR